MKLDSTQKSIPTANDNLSKINNTQGHTNYYCKDITSKIVKQRVMQDNTISYH
jgi:hypothetical protein